MNSIQKLELVKMLCDELIEVEKERNTLGYRGLPRDLSDETVKRTVKVARKQLQDVAHTANSSWRFGI